MRSRIAQLTAEQRAYGSAPMGANVLQPGHAGPMRAIVAWILAPTETSERSRGVGLAGLRVLVGLLWLYHIVWKLPPEFGRDTGGQFYGLRPGRGAGARHRAGRRDRSRRVAT